MSDDLSRLLAGELDPAEAEALQGRIAADPALAERWARTQELPGKIAGLPRTLSPPPDLHLGAGGLTGPPQRPRSPVVGAPALGGGSPRAEASRSDKAPPRRGNPPPVLLPREGEKVAEGRMRGTREGPPRRVFQAVALTGWLAAAALALVALRPPPTRVLLDGTELVEGHADVLAGDLRVEIYGRARVSVEPSAAGGREVEAENRAMSTSHVLAALAGSVVTVTVMEGAAWLRADDAPPVEVAAGETRTVRREPEGLADASEPMRRGARHPDRARRHAERRDPTDMPLERQAQRVEREKAMAEARLQRREGEAQPWPYDAPGAFRPEAFERYVTDRLAGIPDTEIAAMDCDEYPCVAVLQSHADAPDWEERLRGLHEGIDGAGFGESLQVIGMASEARTEEGAVRLYAFAVAPGDLPEPARQRLHVRADGALRDLSAELVPGP